MTYSEKDPDPYHQFLSLRQLPSVLNPTDDCQEFPCGRGEKGITPYVQGQRGDTDTISTDLLALLDNSEIIEPLSLVVRKNQVERRTPVTLKAPYPYVSNLLALEWCNWLNRPCHFPLIVFFVSPSGGSVNFSGSSSDMAMYSPLHIRSANLSGTGGVDDTNTTGAVDPGSSAIAGIGVAANPEKTDVLVFPAVLLASSKDEWDGSPTGKVMWAHPTITSLGPPSSTRARGPPVNLTPQPQIPPAAILRSIPLITSAPTTVNYPFHPNSTLAITACTLLPSRQQSGPGSYTLSMAHTPLCPYTTCCIPLVTYTP